MLKPLNFETNQEEHSNDKTSKRRKRRNRNGQLRLSDTTLYEFEFNDLIDHGFIASGNYGIVRKMEHNKSGTIMAVKEVLSHLYEQNEKQSVIKELDIFIRENTCPHIVQFYGTSFQETQCWICMELMDTSFDLFYKFVYHKLNQVIPESVLAYIAVVILQTLHYLKSRWQIIDRNIHPSNILVSRTGIKLSDFGITDKIVNKFARNDSFQSDSYIYLSPEKIDSGRAMCEGNYDVQSTVWSFGITMYELSTGYYPFSEWKSVFRWVRNIMEGPPFKLTVDRLSDHCKDFVNTCLIKNENERPKYKQLLEHPFLDQTDDLKKTEHAIVYLSDIINELEQNTDTFERYYLPSSSQ